MKTTARQRLKTMIDETHARNATIDPAEVERIVDAEVVAVRREQAARPTRLKAEAKRPNS